MDLTKQLDGYLYVASPYSNVRGLTPDYMYEQVKNWIGEWYQAHPIIPVYSPILHHHAVAEKFDLPKSFDFWQHIDCSMLKSADSMVVLQLPGWAESKGIYAEAHYASRNKIPIYYVMPPSLTPVAIPYPPFEHDNG